MIEVGMGVQDTNNRQAKTPHFGKKLLGIPSRIDNDRLARFRVP